jgi:hypothetical protein
MKYDAKYIFKVLLYSSSNPLCKLDKHFGVLIPKFSIDCISIHEVDSFLKTIPAYIDIGDVIRFKHILMIKGVVFIGLRHIKEMPNFHYGYFNDDAVLVKFERNENEHITEINVWFFKDKKQQSVMLYDEWVSHIFELD